MVSFMSCVTAAAAKSLQSYPTLCDPIDGSPPGSPVHGIFQAGVLEWGAIAYIMCTLLQLSFLFKKLFIYVCLCWVFIAAPALL